MAAVEQVRPKVKKKSRNSNRKDDNINSNVDVRSNVSSDSEKEQDDLSQELDNVRHEISEAKSHMLQVNRKLLPRERKLCLEKEELALDISKHFSDLRHQINQMLLQEEHKMQNKLNDIVEGETKLFAEQKDKCKSLLDGLSKSEEVLGAVDLEERTQENCDIVSNVKEQLQDYKQLSQKFEDATDAPLKLRFNINIGLLDIIKDYNFGIVECVNPSVPIDAVPEESNVSGMEPNTDEINDQGGDRESVTCNTNVLVDVDNESDNTSYNDEEEGSTQGEFSINEQEGSPGVGYQEASVDDSDTGYRQYDDTPSEQSHYDDTPSEQSHHESRHEQYNDIPDEPPPPYPGLPENFHMYQPYTQQMGAYSYNTPPLPYCSSPRSPIPQVPSAPPAPQNYDYRNRRSQEFIPPVLQSYSPHVEDGEKLFNISVISRVNSSSHGYDRRKPGISGIIWVDHSFFLIADRWNCCIKLVHQSSGTYRILSFGNFEPWDITQVEKNLSAVTLPKARKIYTVRHSDGRNMAIKSTIVTAKGYSSLSYCKSVMLYVGAVCPQFGSPCVEILDSRGIIQNNFCMDRYRQPLFDYPRAVEIVDDNIIAVSDYKKSNVTFIRMDGEPVATYTGCDRGYKLKDPQGIAAYEAHKLLFVIDSQQNSIHTVSNNGEYKGVLKDRDNMSDPKRLCLWKESGPLKLAVALGSGYISTFRLDELHEYV